jgi:lipopolysaccharide export system permease protein
MIIDRYMVREIGLPFIAVSVVLVIIFATFSLTRFLVDANAGLLQPGEVVSLMALRSLVSLEVLLPLSFYFAVMLGMGRLYSDSEIYAMRSSGISEARLMRPVFMLALLLAAVTFVLSVAARPWAYERSYQIRAEAKAASEVDRIRPAQFYQFPMKAAASTACSCAAARAMTCRSLRRSTAGWISTRGRAFIA